ncbi:hypothetical protein M3Y95_00419300 [Aphelenchoides besseyi]|nr:hypothetical protein M3Y95_00419300 [Aphelenchoides besseyi]
MLFVAVFLFAAHTRRVDSILCSQCSYFPGELEYLADELVDDTSKLSNLDETQRLIVQQVQNATRNNNTQCFRNRSKYTFECTDSLNTCVLQMVEWIEVAKSPAVLYTCSRISKSGCVSDENEHLKWTMCACHEDDCSKIQWNPGLLLSHNSNSTDSSDEEMDEKSQKIISARIY